jgi:deoxycytidylate deaminase
MIVKVRKRWYDAADSVCFTLPCSDCAAKINQSGINIVGDDTGKHRVSHFVTFTTLRNRTLAGANLCGCQVSHIQE